MADATYSARSPDHTNDHVRQEPTYLDLLLKRTAWGAIVAGALVAISIQGLLTVLGVAIGLAVADNAHAEQLSVGAGIWWLITGTISLLIGGTFVGRLAGMERGRDVLLHAFTMWALTAVFGFIIASGGLGVALGAVYGNGAGRAAPDSAQVSSADRDRSATRDDSEMVRTQAGTNIDSEAARQNARNASWWTLFAMALGIAASLGGAWLTAPREIVMRTPNAV